MSTQARKKESMSIRLSLTLIAAVGAEVCPTNSGLLSFLSGREASWNPGGDTVMCVHDMDRHGARGGLC